MSLSDGIPWYYRLTSALGYLTPCGAADRTRKGRKGDQDVDDKNARDVIVMMQGEGKRMRRERHFIRIRREWREARLQT